MSDGSDCGSYTNRGTNPFDGSTITGSESSERNEVVVNNIEKIRFSRGALMSGVVSNDGTSRNNKDLESGLHPPDSDYASRVPRSLLESTLSPDDAARRNAQSLVIQGVANAANASKRRNSYLWMALGLISLMLIGAIIAVAVVLSGGNDDNTKAPDYSSLTERQQMLNDIVVEVSEADTFEDPDSPQSKARHWLVYDDSLLSGPDSNPPTKSRVIQRYVLAVFYFATSGPTAWSSNNWLKGEECTNDFWDFISCNDDGEVRALALDGVGLNGTIPAEVGHLKQLENLVVKNESRLTGKIPQSFGHLSNLKQLGLYYNALTGSIPIQLYLATNLRLLNLQDNELEGDLEPQVEVLKELETLVLTNNRFGGNVPWENLALTPIHYLGLSNNGFSGELSELLGDFSKLRYLYLNGNGFQGKIPESIARATNLRSISMDKNKLTGELPTTFGQLSSLEYLSLQSNELTGPLPNTLAELTSLQTLSLASNKFSGSLPDLLPLKDLVYLYLFQNELNGTILESFAELESLEVLFLSSNFLRGKIPSSFGEPIDGDHRLRGLYLSDNLLEGSIPTSLCNLKNLEALFLDENKLSGPVRPCFGRLEELQQLYLFKNQLTGGVPVELSSLRKLVGVGMEENELEGEVPAEVCELATDVEFEFWTDCEGDTPELRCPCCTHCCPSPECT